ncbi:MAG: FprA family A-type flavoprotein [Candidatus Bathyarchaeota archaeon]|nr:MAG: FprA family A-type flavoprotein [Candidatus Bathyarchaeota archaeon]
MILTELREGIHWVGVVDWNVRNFHGYITHRGTTYTAYLIVDDEIALVDTVKDYFFPEMMSRIQEIVNPSDIDYLVSNHTEPDHSGAITKFLDQVDTELIASEMGVRNLRSYYGENLEVTSIKEKPTLSLGKRTLNFVPVPMVHWPDSMVTYIPEEKLLLSNDAFGQHLASSWRFDDEVDEAVLMQEAATYYANIVMPLWMSVGRALKALGGVDVEMIAPSHGVIWRSDPDKILEAYKRWVEGETLERAVVVYDTMWGSTEMVARALVEGLADEGVEVRVHRLRDSHNSDVVADLMEARAVLVGSPTLNNGLFPSVASFLTYMKGLKPRNKIGAFFGSYGWGGGATRAGEAELISAGIELIECKLDYKFRPTVAELEEARECGKRIAARIKSN